MTSFFSGPFSTPVGALIERSTKEDGDVRNDGVNRAIIYEIGANADGPSQAVKALKKRLFNNKNWRIVLNTLSLLELMMRECSRSLQLLIAHHDFLQSLVNLTVPKANSPTVVRDFVLLLIQKWAHDFQNVHELVTICAMYETLKQKGTEFPSRDLSELTPILSLQRTASDSPPARQSPTMSRQPARQSPTMSRQPARQSPSTMSRQPQQPAPTAVVQAQQGAAGVSAPPMPGQQAQESGAPGPVQPSTQQETKLRGELEIVRMNTNVLKALLAELSPGTEALSDFQLMQDLNSTCRTMRSRIVELIDRISHDELICELLSTNDDLNNTFTEYDAYMVRRDTTLGISADPATLGVGAAGPLAAPPGPSPSRSPALPTASGDAGVSLIDMDDSYSPPVTTGIADINLDLYPGQAAPADDDDDFDSFAQSRGQGDMASGGHPAVAPQPACESRPVTSSEFDDFLARRSTAPMNGGNATTSANIFNPGPSMHGQAAGGGGVLQPTAAPTAATSTMAPSSSHDSALQDLLDFAAPAPQVTSQGTQNPVPGGRPAMQTNDPTADMFGF